MAKNQLKFQLLTQYLKSYQATLRMQRIRLSTYTLHLRKAWAEHYLQVRVQTLRFPEEVQICGPIEASSKKGDSGTFSKVNDSFIEVGEDSIKNLVVGSKTTVNKNEVVTGQDSDMSTFAFTVPSAGNAVTPSLNWKSTANTITFKSCNGSADFTGDIKMNVTVLRLVLMLRI